MCGFAIMARNEHGMGGMGNSPCRRNYKVTKQEKETVESGLGRERLSPRVDTLSSYRISPDIPRQGGIYQIDPLLESSSS